MDAWSDDSSPPDEGDEGAEVIWLFDADAEPEIGPLTPGALFARLEQAAAREGLRDVSVRGVVCGVRHRGRVCTFELADQPTSADVPEALLRVVLFANDYRAIQVDLARDGRRLVDGMEATVTGALRFDPPFGGFRLVVRAVEAHEDQGELAARREALLADLASAGLLTAQAALVVPGRPLRVGLIASSGTAGDADVQALLDASGLEWQVLRRPVPMGGANAPGALAAALERLADARPDVIVIARGGGSRAELACWDGAVVAQAIARCPVPVWTAIGHATDSTVADRVANRSCATPSAAAATLVERVRDFERHRHERVVLAAHRERVAAERTRTRRARVIAVCALLALVAVFMLALR